MNSKPACLLLFLLGLAAAAGAQDAATWIHTSGATGPVASAFESLVFSFLENTEAAQFRRQELDVSSLRKRLRQLKPGHPHLVIHCTLPEYLRMLKDPAVKALLADLHLNLLNARLFSFPFYLLKTGDASPRERVDLAWITLPGEAHPVEEADLLTMLSEALGRPKSSLKIYRERGAYPAAKKLHEGGYRLIGIYDSDPSSLLDEFRINWQDELRAGVLEFFPMQPGQVFPQLVPVVPGRFSYFFFSYKGAAFGGEVPGSRPMLAIAQEIEHPFPVILSNMDLAKALSFAYFLMPSMPVVRSEPESRRRRVEQMYLLNSYLEDPDNRAKSLGLLDLLMMNQELGEKSQKEIYAAKCALFQRNLQIPETSAVAILKWLGMEAPELGKRELFSSDVSRLYEEALKQIDQALLAAGPERTRLLEKARAGMVAALLQGSRPKNVQGSRGLWSVTNYNPHYQLARIALYLDLERRGKR